jgi:hypothetical protein
LKRSVEVENGPVAVPRFRWQSVLSKVSRGISGLGMSLVVLLRVLCVCVGGVKLMGDGYKVLRMSR